MRLAVMQPYFFPYIGYFQLINEADEFVIYDNIEFTKKGWINRNRILVNGKDAYITLPLRKDSDYLDVRGRYLADTWTAERSKMLNRIRESYRRAPQYNRVYPVIENAILFEDRNLFNFILHSLCQINGYLGISTSVVISSTIEMNHELKAGEKVIELCKARGADSYLNPIGGIELYSRETFKNAGIGLQFLKSDYHSYKQFNNEFIPWLSIIDVMMFNDGEEIKKMLDLNTIQ
jgi:hypothetical protein